MQFVHALIIALLTWLVATAFPMWLRWSMYFGAPLVSGLINGLLLGDLTYGLQCGGTIMMAYIGLVAIGGSLPSDLSLAGYLGVYMTMASNADPSVGLPIAVSLGFLGILCSNAKMSLNPIWVHKADKYAAEGNTKGVIAMNLFGSQVVPFITYFIPAFLCVLLGAPFMEKMLAIVPAQVISILKLIGSMIPALGLAMLMNMMNKKSTIPFFLMGFVLAAYLKLDIIALAILGAAFGILHLLYTSGRREQENV
ncbi:PTS mannose/fructose/sorbose/N-acetylgalactosamine transporter subunit IIC [Oscillospiraceae bacterium LTW-04]|nr:PTS sugar transporter subunit IIC [Oscillospiraceae bacterium MB24-C1]